jgi:hypothetical protein
MKQECYPAAVMFRKILLILFQVNVNVEGFEVFKVI